MSSVSESKEKIEKRIGIDIGGSSLKFGVVSRDRIIEKISLKINEKSKKESIIEELCNNALKLCEKHGIRKISIACAGLISRKGLIEFSPNLKMLNSFDLKNEVQSCFGDNFNVIILNDVNAHAIAEKKFGKAREFNDFVLIALGTGVGGGIFIDNKLYLGMHGFAGELGHSKVFLENLERKHKLRCECGAYNCLETFSGARYIAKRAEKIFKRRISSEEVYLLAKRGDKRAIEIFEISGRALGMAIANIANSMDITNFIISGGVSRAGKFIILPAKKEFKKHALKGIKEKTKIMLSRFKEDAGIIGAANAFDVKIL